MAPPSSTDREGTLTTITITHTPEDGTVVVGDPRPHHQLLKNAGFRWSRNVGWYIRGSRDQRPQTHRINTAAEALRSVGFEVVVDVDQELAPIAEREARRNERLDDRQEALAAKAERKAGEADAQLTQARAMADVIPFGQPILVGHHSERADRRYRDRIGRTYEKGFEAHNEATEAARKAEASEANQWRHEALGPTLRRIAKLEADKRGRERRLVPCPISGLKMKPEAEGRLLECPTCYRDLTVVDREFPEHGAATGADAERLRSEIIRIDEDLTYWRAHVTELEANGQKVWGPDDFSVGDRVNGRMTVVRINKKSLTVRYDVFAHTNTLKYDAVHGVEKLAQP